MNSKDIRNEIFDIRMKIKLEMDSQKKLLLMEEEKVLLDKYKKCVVQEKMLERGNGVKR